MGAKVADLIDAEVQAEARGAVDLMRDALWRAANEICAQHGLPTSEDGSEGHRLAWSLLRLYAAEGGEAPEDARDSLIEALAARRRRQVVTLILRGA